MTQEEFDKKKNHLLGI
ncbi:MAG TPA: hypothetical protein PLK31_06330 [Chloroflexota bacterium]|nr:hypothetical protein [Chloroflexota bacterium]